MAIDVKEVLNTAGPTASLVFASWIFLSLISQRLSSAVDRFRALTAERRANPPDPERTRELDTQIALYRRRSELLRRAMMLGILAAITLLLTLLLAMTAMCHPRLAPVGYVGLATAAIGLSLLIAASVLLLRECGKLAAALSSEAGGRPEPPV